MEDYSPLSSPTFSLGGSSVASSLGSPRPANTLRRLSTMFSKRERKVTLKDIERAIRRAYKSSEAAQKQRKALSDTLLVWVTQSADDRYREIASKLHETLLPLWSSDPNEYQQISDVLAKIDNLKREEAQRDRLNDERTVAEKLVYRGKWKGFSPVDLEPLQRSLQLIRVQAETAEARFRRSSGRMLYLALHSFLVQCEESSGARQLACQNAVEILREQNESFAQAFAFTSERFDHSTEYQASQVDQSDDERPEDCAYNARNNLLERAMEEGNIMCSEYATPFGH